MRPQTFAIAVLALTAKVACAPDWSDNPALVIHPRIIALVAEPPELEPGGATTVTAVVATPEGPATPDIEWALCKTPKPPAENGAVSPACASEPLPAEGPPAPSVRLGIPSDACRLFGPETPPRVGDAPPLRPRDADPTGGYYQPVRAAGVGSPSFAAVRIICNLASAPLEAAIEFRQKYRPNRNPRFGELSAAVDGAAVPFDALPADRAIDLMARWSPDTAEGYLAFDPATQALRDRREALRVSWFVSAGTIANPSVGRAEDDPETNVTTNWKPPRELASGGRVHLWAVLRDSRGGVAVEHRELVLE